MATTDPEESDPVEVINRSDWKAEPPVSPIPIETPVKHVFYTETETLECKTKEQCSEIVRGIQKFHMEFKGISDIQHHFLIGGDGSVYEGRGWFTSGVEYPKNHRQITPEMSGKSIEIAFIGSYKDKEPSPEMKLAANSLIYYGIQNKLLDDSVVGGRVPKKTNKLKYSSNDTTNNAGNKPDRAKCELSETDSNETKNYNSNK